MFAEERQQAMARLVATRGRLSVATLAEEYAVTTETVRRDLSALERLGLVRRVHGGAVPHGALVLEPGLGDRDRASVEEKERIARAAIEQLPPAGSTVVVDAGTTTARLAAALPHDLELTVFTNSIAVAARLSTLPRIELHLLPGRVRTTTQAAVGGDTVTALHRLRADAVFLGTNGLTISHGLSTPDRDEAATKRAMVGCAERIVVLADADKVGQESPTSFAAIEEVDVLVTDSSLAPTHRRELRRAGLEVVLA